MKKIVLLCGALLTLTAVAANAQLNLAIGDCGGAPTASWTCTSNTGVAFVAVASVTAPSAPPIQTLTGEAASIEVAFGNPVPAWWKTGTGQCRLATSMAIGFTAPASGGCIDYFGVVGSGPSGGSYMFIGPTTDPAPDGDVALNEVRVRTVSAVDGVAALDPSTVQPAPGDNVFLFTLTVNKGRTVGTGACAGCAEPACLVFTRVLLSQPVGVGDYVYVAEMPHATGFVTLQGGTPDCPQATPASRSSWGQVKSLYR